MRRLRSKARTRNLAALLLWSALLTGPMLGFSAEKAAPRPGDPNCNEKLEKPVSLAERYHFYKEKVAYEAFNELGSIQNLLRLRFKLPGLSGLSRPHLNPLGGKNKAENNTLDGEGGEGDEDAENEGGGKDGKPHVVAEFTAPGIYYFRRSINPVIHFRSGSYAEGNILNSTTRKIGLGISAGVMTVENAIPRMAFDLPVPAGFRPIPQPKNSPVKIVRDEKDRYYFRSSRAGRVEIHFGLEQPIRLSRRELLPFLGVHEPIALQEWPEDFQNMLRALIEQVSENRSTIVDIEVANVVRSMIQNYLFYSKTKSSASNTIEMVVGKRCQCDWAAVLTVGILRQYFGIPSRVVVGDTGKGHQRNPDKSYIVQSNSLHAWAEVYESSDYRWHIVDSTPSTEEEIPSSERSFWEKLRRGQRGGGQDEFSQKDDDFYDFGSGRGDRKDSELSDMFKRWAESLRNQQRDGKSQKDGGNGFDFGLGNLFGQNRGGPDRTRPPGEKKEKESQAFDLDSASRIDRQRRITYAVLQSTWQTILEQSHTSELLMQNLYAHIAELKDREFRCRSLSPEYAPLGETYRWALKRAHTLLTRVLSGDLRYSSYTELTRQMRTGAPAARIVAASFTSVLYTELSRFRSLTPFERNRAELAREVLTLVSKVSSEATSLALFTALKERGKLFAIDYLLQKKYGMSPDLDRFMADYRSGALDDWLKLVRIEYFFSQTALNSEGFKVTETPDRVSVPISDEDPEFTQADDISRYRNFLRKGYGFKYDLFRFAAGVIDEKQYQDDSENMTETFTPNLTAVAISYAPTNLRPEVKLAAFHLVAASQLRGENLVLVLPINGELTAFRNPDEILNLDPAVLDQPSEALTRTDYQEFVERLEADRYHVLALLRDPNVYTEVDGAPVEIPRTRWPIVSALRPDRPTDEDDDEPRIELPIVTMDDPLNDFKTELERWASLDLDRTQALQTAALAGAELGASTANKKDVIHGGDQLVWSMFVRVMQNRMQSYGDVSGEEVVATAIGEWHEIADAFYLSSNRNGGLDAQQQRSLMRFSEIVMGRRLPYFALGQPQSLLKEIKTRLGPKIQIDFKGKP